MVFWCYPFLGKYFPVPEYLAGTWIWSCTDAGRSFELIARACDCLYCIGQGKFCRCVPGRPGSVDLRVDSAGAVLFLYNEEDESVTGRCNKV